MGKLTQAFKQGPPPDPRRRCGVCDWVATLDAEDQAMIADLAVAIRERRPLSEDAPGVWNYSNAHEQCQAGGLKLALPRFASHMKGECGRG